MNVPQAYRATAPQQAAAASALGNEEWWQVYQDPMLTLIHTALAQNYEVSIAAAQRAFWNAAILSRAAGDIVRLRPLMETTFFPLALA